MLRIDLNGYLIIINKGGNKLKIETDRYKLYNGDCLEIMDKLIEEGVIFDAIITDIYRKEVQRWLMKKM